MADKTDNNIENETASKLENLKLDNKDDQGDEKHENGIEDSNNEDRKIFVGGISAETTQEDLLAFFSKYGPVSQAQVKYDRNTGRSRGFAFVEFQTTDACQKAQKEKDQTIKQKPVEIKPAKSRENKKVFVGGLPADFPEDKLRSHFEQYGKVDDIEWPFDRHRSVKRNFAFIVFETEEGADRASEQPKQLFGERECDVKKATPQARRNNLNNIMPGPYGGAFYGAQAYGGRGGYFNMARGGGRGGMSGGFGSYGNSGYGSWGGAPPGGAAAWNDWYAQYGGAYGGGYGHYGYSGHAPADYWQSSGSGQQSNAAGAGSGGASNTWGNSGGGYDSYGGASGNAPGGGQSGGRQGGGSRSYGQQNFQH